MIIYDHILINNYMSMEYSDARGGRGEGGRGEVNVFTFFQIKNALLSKIWSTRTAMMVTTTPTNKHA